LNKVAAEAGSGVDTEELRKALPDAFNAPRNTFQLNESNEPEMTLLFFDRSRTLNHPF
jgi:hypothetical protein